MMLPDRIANLYLMLHCLIVCRDALIDVIPFTEYKRRKGLNRYLNSVIINNSLQFCNFITFLD